MKVTLNPVNNNYSFKAKSVSKQKTPVQPTQREITDAKIKKSVSECFWVVLGVASLYFFTKIKSNSNKLTAQREELKNRTKQILDPILPSEKHIEAARNVQLAKNYFSARTCS